MRISDGTLEKMLGRANLATPEQITTFKEQAERLKRTLQEVILSERLLDERSLTQAFADYAQIPFVDLSLKGIPKETLELLPERVARQYKAIVFRIEDDGSKALAMEDPDDIQAINFIQKELGTNTHIYIATRDDMLTALENYRDDVNKELSEVIDFQQSAADAEKLANPESEIAEDSPIAQTVNLLLEYAIRSHASDVHLEPREDYVQVRYRIDGVLKEVNRLPQSVQGPLVSRIKILATLKIDERRVPQDGRFKITVAGRQYALRVSTLPIADGEKIVMRILDESNQAVGLDDLGFWGSSLTHLDSEIHQPDGIVLMTGPTGSGKSTSLFSILTILNSPNVNISTIEDPVEYKIEGVNQTQTNAKAGMTFANGLRALLRQDPNIIMIGEIRDGETANLGIQAALTGHMVFSTLHTNNAATSLPRLLDMGIEPFLIASTVRAVVGQRLVRRLHKESRQQYEPTTEEKQEITRIFNLSDPQTMKMVHELEKQAAKSGMGGDIPLSTDENGIISLWKADHDTNDNGVHEGYRGRVGVYEVLVNSQPIQKMIMSHATSDDIQKQAISEGMVTMQLDGLVKALRGETTIEEILRVTRE